MPCSRHWWRCGVGVTTLRAETRTPHGRSREVDSTGVVSPFECISWIPPQARGTGHRAIDLIGKEYVAPPLLSLSLSPFPVAAERFMNLSSIEFFVFVVCFPPAQAGGAIPHQLLLV
eukprot:2078415-Heterocapsa_arctica.AAC.1